MINGNPDSFAILWDKVDSWSNGRFKNGCFGYFLGGRLIWTLRSTLGVDFNKLRLMNAMNNSVEDEYLFNIDHDVAYKDLCLKAFPSMDSDVEDSDFNNLISSASLLDEGWNIFLVEFGSKAKIIFGFEGKEVSVDQVILGRGEFQVVVRDALREFESRS